jgi:hypothetical protein
MKIFDQGSNYYVPSFFWIELNTSLELKDILNTKKEHVFFHEYLHFLQDLILNYGLTNTSKVLNVIKSMYHNVKDLENKGNFYLNVPFDFSADKFRETNNKLFRNYLGYVKTLKVDNIIIEKVIESVTDVNGYKLKTYKVQYNKTETVNFGAHALIESICQILQKRCYNLTVAKKYLPYDLPELVAIHYCNFFEKNQAAIIDLCEYSLMFYNSAEIFMYLLEELKKDSYIPQSTGDFYNYMYQKIQPEGESIESLFDKSITLLKEDIQGVFTSELYDGFKKWIFNVLDNAIILRKNNKLVFSILLKSNPTNFLMRSIINIGMPPTFNQEGQMFVKNEAIEISDWVYLARAVSEVFSTLIYGNKECGFKEACMSANDARNKKININEYCDNEPWKKINETELCPYCQVWKTFGLSNMKIV